MLVNDLRGLVIPASFNKHHSRSIPGTGSASIIHAGKGSQGLVIPASFSKYHSPGIIQQASFRMDTRDRINKHHSCR